MVCQCAWCNSFTIKGLRISNPVPKSKGYSHGICLKCKDEVLGRKEERPSEPEAAMLSI